jgi:hypothetical protein
MFSLGPGYEQNAEEKKHAHDPNVMCCLSWQGILIISPAQAITSSKSDLILSARNQANPRKRKELCDSQLLLPKTTFSASFSF